MAAFALPLAALAAPARGAITSWGSFGSGEGQFKEPEGIATFTDGSGTVVYVVDRQRNDVQKFSSSGSYVTKWGGSGQLSNPAGIATDGSGNVYAADTGNARVKKYDSNGALLATSSDPSSFNPIVTTLVGVAVPSSGSNIYTTELEDRLRKFNSTGTAQEAIVNDSGSGNGQFNQPRDVATDSAGSVYVVDTNNDRVQKFDSSLNFVTKWGSSGSGDGQFNQPWGIGIDSADNVYVVERAGSRIQKFTPSGNFVAKLALSAGSPYDVAVDGSGNVYIAAGSQVLKYDTVPLASISSSGAPALTSQTVSFDASGSSMPLGSITKYEWDLDGNGSYETDTGTTATTSRVYSQEGTYAAKVRVTGSSAQTSTATANVVVNPSSASVSANQNPAFTSQTVTFDASGSAVSGSTISRYEWDLDGDGGFETDTAATATASRLYGDAGTVAVKARVTRSGGRQDTATLNLEVKPSAASFTASPNPVSTGQTVAFDAAGSGLANSSITKYEWDLDGNGSYETGTATTATTSKSYAAVGTVPVRLRVTRSGGRVDTAGVDLSVRKAAPKGRVGVSINEGDQYTNDPKVEISAVWPKLAIDMLASNDGGFAEAETFVVETPIDWKLDSSGPERLPKTVYVRFRGGRAGNETYTDDIILDETPPKIVSAVAAPVAAASTAAATAAAARKRAYAVRVKATDKTSGVGRMQITNRKRKPGKLLPYRKVTKFRSASKTIYVRVRDRAGNFSKWRKLKDKD